MNDMALAELESLTTLDEPSTARCPMGVTSEQRRLVVSDELILPNHKSMIVQYSKDESGKPELHLYFGEKEISFDDPNLFAFGENVAKLPRFVAQSATRWGTGYAWSIVAELLQQLIDEGILKYATETVPNPIIHHGKSHASPLPPTQTSRARTWFECEDITRELTGHAVEMGYLELIVPIFRVAHIALDAEGRQVGEANVFPKPLRLDVPTEWRGCPHAGSRYQSERPMNVTALKSMRDHWPQMMTLLLRIREKFLFHFPTAEGNWTVGDLERLASLVLAIPAYQLMRTHGRVENGDLHPALSSLFRVTDGVRMTMHQMLFLPLGEATRSPDAPMTRAEIYNYAERNYVFVSSHGVCAGPKAMIEEFLGVLVDGHVPKSGMAVVLDPPVQRTLDELDAAFEYGLSGLQAHAIVFSLWPAMGRAYERIWEALESWPEDSGTAFFAVKNRFEKNVLILRTQSLLANEEWRTSREHAYADMYAHCTQGLGSRCADERDLMRRISPNTNAIYNNVHVARRMRSLCRQHFSMSADSSSTALDRLVSTVMDYLNIEQAVVRAASEVQANINYILQRTPPLRPLTAADLDLYNQMQGQVTRLPNLVQELNEILGVEIVVTQDEIAISERLAI